MPAFAADGTVTCPLPAAWLEFFNADKNQWPANAYKREDCTAAREFSHGSVVSALPDGSFPPVFLWDKLSYRVIAKGADGSTVATIERVTPDSEFVAFVAAEPEHVIVTPEPEPEPAPTVDLAAENEALRRRIAELETIPEPTPDPEPETHFADLMLADETLDDAKARLSQRLRELRHYLIAPEIKVNEDGSVGLTGEEQSELQDLERRQTLGRWLDA
jgi:hypothetical protein